MIEVQYFDGSGGCDLCKLSTGYTIDQAPEPPHPHCNCPVELIDTDDLADCHCEIRDVHVEPDTMTSHQDEEEFNCLDEADTVAVGELDEEEYESFEEGVREAAEAEGWTEPDVEHAEFAVLVPGNHIATFEVEVTRYFADFSAPVWLVCSVEGEVTESMIEVRLGRYEKNTSIEATDITLEECPDGMIA